jgi:hypothetical protein
MFYECWILSAIGLLVVAALFGKKTRNSPLGILMDDRERYSLNHLQVVMWTILILSTWLGIFISSGFNHQVLAIPQQLLVLMGISLGSATLTGAVKSSKDAPGSGARPVIKRKLLLSDGATKNMPPSLRQVITEEEGDQADQTVSVTKFQNLIFTFVAGFTYIVLTYKANAFPTLPQEVIWLIGISHAGYIGGKIPNKQ